jgi:hypothetical protein
MIEWAKEWLGMNFEQRLEAAKKDATPYTSARIIEMQKYAIGSKYMCNVCKQTKSYPPYGHHKEDSEYVSRFYCQECLQKAGILW